MYEGPRSKRLRLAYKADPSSPGDFTGSSPAADIAQGEALTAEQPQICLQCTVGTKETSLARSQQNVSLHSLPGVTGVSTVSVARRRRKDPSPLKFGRGPLCASAPGGCPAAEKKGIGVTPVESERGCRVELLSKTGEGHSTANVHGKKACSSSRVGLSAEHLCNGSPAPARVAVNPLAEKDSASTPAPLQKGLLDDSPASGPLPAVARRLQRADTEDWFRERYRQESITPLCKTAFSEILVVVEISSGQRRALKKVDKVAVQHYLARRGSHLAFQNEVDLMRRVQHPGIVHLYEAFETNSSLCMVMDLLEGGDLFSFMLRHGALQERHARRWFSDLCQALRHLHDQGVVHRDLKPQNILLTTDSSVADVKLADFGISRHVPSTYGCDTFCGTLDYIAPEVFGVLLRTSSKDVHSGSQASGYGKAADMWSLGVILYILLSGIHPFDCAADKNVVVAQVMQAAWEFDVEAWDAVSPNAKDLVSKLLTKCPSERLTIRQVLEHPWMTKGE